jgi:hypothetical protein
LCFFVCFSIIEALIVCFSIIMFVLQFVCHVTSSFVCVCSNFLLKIPPRASEVRRVHLRRFARKPMDVPGLGCLKDAYAVLGGTQAPTAWDVGGVGGPRLMEDAFQVLGRCILMEDAQVNHESVNEVFPRIGLMVDCNSSGLYAGVRRLARSHCLEKFVSDFEYAEWDTRNPLAKVACLDVFDEKRRSDMLSALVMMVSDVLKCNLDVVFHDQLGVCLCVLAMAAVQKTFTGVDIYVSDVEFTVS